MSGNRSYLRTAPTDVYRVYDHDGGLLYVGIATRLIVRLGQHRREAPWWGGAAWVDVEEHGSGFDARRVEAEAIATEHPRWNVRPEAVNRRLLTGAPAPRPLDVYELDIAALWGKVNA